MPRELGENKRRHVRRQARSLCGGGARRGWKCGRAERKGVANQMDGEELTEHQTAGEEGPAWT